MSDAINFAAKLIRNLHITFGPACSRNITNKLPMSWPKWSKIFHHFCNRRIDDNFSILSRILRRKIRSLAHLMYYLNKVGALNRKTVVEISYSTNNRDSGASKSLKWLNLAFWDGWR